MDHPGNGNIFCSDLVFDIFHRTALRSPDAVAGADPVKKEARASKLLKDWLSPAQLSAYEANRYFDVVGCDSGTAYRIHNGIEGNIEQLDALGRPLCRWCFMPQGKLAAGDIMLAQKIALETCETSAIGVANRFAASPQVIGNTQSPLLNECPPGVG